MPATSFNTRGNQGPGRQDNCSKVTWLVKGREGLEQKFPNSQSMICMITLNSRSQALRSHIRIQSCPSVLATMELLMEEKCSHTGKATKSNTNSIFSTFLCSTGKQEGLYKHLLNERMSAPLHFLLFQRHICMFLESQCVQQGL